MWFEVMTALKAHLENTAALNGTVIALGADASIPVSKTVILSRGAFEAKTNDKSSQASQIVYVECWEHDDHVEPESGYQKLATLESDVMAAINGFGYTCINEQRIKVRIGQTEPDGDAFRPSVGSRTAVTIKWQ